MMTDRNVDAPDDEVDEVARAGIRGMISALKTEKFSPDLMVNAALHILATWVASSQTRSSASERADDEAAVSPVLSTEQTSPAPIGVPGLIVE